jgi:hypothetical protein
MQLYCLDHQARPEDIRFEDAWFQGIVNARLPPSLRLAAPPPGEQ